MGYIECLNWWLLDLLLYKFGMFWVGVVEVVDGVIVGWVEDEFVFKIVMKI